MPGMASVRSRWRNPAFDAVFGAAYHFGIEHRWVAKPVGRALFDTNTEMIYDAMGVVGRMPDGSAILDVPCGGGVALQGLRREQRVRYVAADISPAMLDRTRQRARDLPSVELVETDIERMPFEDGEFDLCVCFNGLHCLPDPAAAVREIARVLKPGGLLVGDCVVLGERRRADAWMVAARAAGIFGPTGSVAQVRSWLAGAGLTVRTLERSGAVVHFVATQPATATAR